MPSQGVNIVVDVQGFYDHEHRRFIFKDVACIVYTEEAGVIETFSATISPPRPFKDVKSAKTRKSAMWLTRFHHGIHWDDPGVSYKSMVASLRVFDHTDTTIYVKGKEKISWLRRIYEYSTIQDLDFYSCPAIHNLKKKKKKKCDNTAYENVKLLLSWLMNNK